MNWFDFFQAFAWCILVIALGGCIGFGFAWTVSDDAEYEDYKKLRPKFFKWFVVLMIISVLLISFIKGIGF